MMKNFWKTALVGAIAVAATDAAAATLLTTDTIVENTTIYSDATYIGAPDDYYGGIGGQIVTFDFGDDRIVNGSGSDLNVYEVDFGSPEFGSISVFASLDGISYFDITTSVGTVVDVDGDEIHSNSSFARSYDLDGVLEAARYIRIDGSGTGGSGFQVGFDLDAIGAVNYVLGDSVPPVPLPASFPLLLGAFGILALYRRRS
ncbi:VPLPA-CTERM sorting domain-containing protein [Ovoidimarina sediminis]|uniref:VPLPA-CTERM sorting domain-containing protein n=1 Tax=Ovoidimarina sediminis TaxID=3079856 RepID=UPI00290E708C|nr:VPLPA-CTERM sorting domain-containing protein [Rhodophyticola sp. MJ-SS7]MDU8946459.1 VPLPA-CTERM sorting domain-containing protein [Rhodophyticola sp. MJ-SS7]